MKYVVFHEVKNCFGIHLVISCIIIISFIHVFSIGEAVIEAQF